MTEQIFSISIISLVFTTLLLGFVLAVIVISYRKILDRIHEMRTRELEMKESAQKQSQAVVDEARKKAVEIIASANIFTDEQNKAIREQLNQFSQIQSQHYEQALEQIKSHTNSLVETIASDIKKSTLSDFEKLMASLQSEMQNSKVGLQQSLAQAYQKDYETAKKQLEEYKAAVIKNIDESARQIIKDYSIKVFGRILSFEDHQEFILQALEEAKKKHVL